MSCVEHLQFSTAFQDYYDFYAFIGTKSVELTFEDPSNILYIKKQGLHVLNYCADSLEMISSTFMTGMLWAGGSGHSGYIPVLGNKPTDF
jgi:hypothetical protein